MWLSVHHTDVLHRNEKISDFSPPDSPIILVFVFHLELQNFKGYPLTKYTGVGQIHTFCPLSRCYLGNTREGHSYYTMLIGSHTFLFRPMTFSDLERLFQLPKSAAEQVSRKCCTCVTLNYLH